MEKNSSEILLSKKMTLNGPAINLGIFFMLLGFLMLFASLGMGNYEYLYWVIIFFVSSYFCLISIECVSYDNQNKKLRLYTNYELFTIDKWYKIEDFSALRIKYSIGTPHEPHFYATSTTWYQIQRKSFEIHLISEFDSIEIIRFSDFKKANEFQLKLSELFDLPVLEKTRNRK